MTFLLVFLSLVALLMLAGGIWALWDVNRRQSANLPALFKWAQGPNKVMGNVFGVAMLVGGVLIAGVVISNL